MEAWRDRRSKGRIKVEKIGMEEEGGGKVLVLEPGVMA